METGGERGSGLRRSIDLARSDAWKRDPAFREPHRRGEVLVAAVMSTLLKMWTSRLAALTSSRGADAARVAEEGSKSAYHLLHMIVRGIDYMPPIELEFRDVVDAVLKADEVVAPELTDISTAPQSRRRSRSSTSSWTPLASSTSRMASRPCTSG